MRAMLGAGRAGPEPMFWQLTDFAAGNLRCLAACAGNPRISHVADTPCRVPADFIGICVASAEDPACDDYVIARLREAGVRHVRLDYSYASRDNHTGRFLDRLVGDGFRVCLHVVQPFDEAIRMPAPAAAGHWRAFLHRTFAEVRGRVEMVEAGATCNRRKWQGYRSFDAFLKAWCIARDEAQAAGLMLAGPNVTDFEPTYNAGLLETLSHLRVLPDIQTDNLFVERATEPERFDHKILGAHAAGLLRMNLIRKARTLEVIGRLHGIRDTMCTHVAWSARRVRRFLIDVEEKQADYLARYLVLAAASGSLSRVYWGPLIGQREGLIDDGTQEYPPIPHVTLYGRVPGKVADFRVRPAFQAFQTVGRLLPGAEFRRHVATGPLQILEFVCGDRLLHAVWTVNGRAVDAREVYGPEDAAAAQVVSRDGQTLPGLPDLFTERPVYVFWPDASRAVAAGEPRTLGGLRVLHPSVAGFRPAVHEAWRGIVQVREGDAAALAPDALEGGPGRQTLRHSRNMVWEAPDPARPGHAIVVKKSRIRSAHQRALERNRPSKAFRSWNGAVELLRRGISTPRPLAAFERGEHPALEDSYYVCEKSPCRFSVRQAFSAFRAGADAFEGLPATVLYRTLAAFVEDMHGRGVHHRDLSAGNVLFDTGPTGEPFFSLIDTGRARFHPRALTLVERLSDLKRICHPLHGAGRREFLEAYMVFAKRRLKAPMLVPVALYDFKHWLKKKLRPLRPSRRARGSG